MLQALAVATDAVIINRLRNLWARSGLQARPATETPGVQALEEAGHDA